MEATGSRSSASPDPEPAGSSTSPDSSGLVPFPPRLGHRRDVCLAVRKTDSSTHISLTNLEKSGNSRPSGNTWHFQGWRKNGLPYLSLLLWLEMFTSVQACPITSVISTRSTQTQDFPSVRSNTATGTPTF